MVMVAAVVLLIVNLLGTALGPFYRGPGPAAGEAAIAGYHFSPRDRTELQSMLKTRTREFDLELVNNIVFESLVHADDRRIQLHENWIMWLAGLVYEPASRTQSARRIVAGGRAICSEAAAVVNEVARINGVDARLVALNGHVVSEVRTGDGWQIADPDYGVVFTSDLDTLESGHMSAVMEEKLRLRGYSDASIARYVEFFETPEDNAVLDVGSVSSPRLHAFERFSEWLKWIVPFALLIASLVVIRERSRRSDRRSSKL